MIEHLPFIAEREKEKRERGREREIEETIHLVCITPTIIGKKEGLRNDYTEIIGQSCDYHMPSDT